MFITLEGIEGSGKTTQIPRIVDYLNEKGLDCFVTREPGGTKIGEKIRGIVLDPESNDLTPLAELLLYMADRAQHIASVVAPMLAKGKTILCDRYFDATMVYQGYARGLDINMIDRLHGMVLNNLKPDVTILLDLPVQLGLSRAWKQIKSGSRSDMETRFEEEKLAFHEKVRAGYLALAQREKERIQVVDASGDEEQVLREIVRVLSVYIK